MTVLCFFYQVKKKGKRKVIGVLDIYGFEIFKVVKCMLKTGFVNTHVF